jgi:phage-related protein
VLYSEDDGFVPLLEWLDKLPIKVRVKSIARLERLRETGHALRRPEADFLRDGIHELRFSFNGIQYRILYFFFQGRAVVTHGLTKEGKVPDVEN